MGTSGDTPNATPQEIAGLIKGLLTMDLDTITPKIPCGLYKNSLGSWTRGGVGSGPWNEVTDLFFRVLYLENVVCRMLWSIIYSEHESSCISSLLPSISRYSSENLHGTWKRPLWKASLEKEEHLQTTNFLGSMLVWWGVDLIYWYV